jgi:hypothetical protein
MSDATTQVPQGVTFGDPAPTSQVPEGVTFGDPQTQSQPNTAVADASTRADLHENHWMGKLVPESLTPALETATHGIDKFNQFVSDVAHGTGKALESVGAGAHAGASSRGGDVPEIGNVDDFEKRNPVGAGVIEGTGEVAGGMVADPRNWPFFFMGGGAVRPVLQRLIAAGFTTQMAHGEYESLKQLYKHWDEMQPVDRAKFATEAGLNGYFLKEGVQHIGSVQPSYHEMADWMLKDPNWAKGITHAEKLPTMAQAMKAIKEHPELADSIRAKMAQEKAQNSLLARKVGMQTETVGNQEVPVSNKSVLASAAKVANPDAARQAAIEQTGPAVAEGIGNVGKEAVGATGDTVTSEKDPFGLHAHADEVEARSHAGFNKIDELSGGKLKESQRRADLAAGKDDWEAVNEEHEKQDALFDEYRNHPELKAAGIDVDTLKSDWRKQLALRRIANRLASGATERSESGNLDYQIKQGRQLADTVHSIIGKVDKKTGFNDFERAGFTPEHVEQLKKFGDIVENEANIPKVSALTHGIARAAIGALGFAHGGLFGATAGIAGEVGIEKLVSKVADKVVGDLMRTPEALRIANDGLEAKAKVKAENESNKSDLSTLGLRVINALKDSSPDWLKSVGNYAKKLMGSETGTAVMNPLAWHPGAPLEGVPETGHEIQAPEGQVDYEKAIHDAMSAEDERHWTPANSEDVKKVLTGVNGADAEIVGSVSKGKSSANDLDVHMNKVDGYDAALKSLGYKYSHDTPHGEVWDNGKTGKAIDIWWKNGDGEQQDNSNLEIGSRRPSDVSATGENNPEHLPNMDAILEAEKGRPGYINELVNSFEGYAKANGLPLEETKGLDPKARLDKIIEHLSSNLEWLHNQMPPELREVAKQWYDTAHTMTKQMAERYRVPHQVMAAVTAALSPKNGWDNNVGMAERLVNVFQNYREHPFDNQMETKLNQILSNDKLKPEYRAMLNSIRGKSWNQLEAKSPEALLGKKAVWIRVFDEAHNSKQTPVYAPDGTVTGHQNLSWGMPNPMAKAIQILEGDHSTQHINEMMGAKNKIRSFYNNIINPNSPRGHVTIDTHAVNATMLKPMSSEAEEVLHNFSGAPKHSATGLEGAYAVHAAAYHKAAQKLGIKPRELQSITWEGIRTLFGDEKKTPALKAAVDEIWKQHQGSKGQPGVQSPEGHFESTESKPTEKTLTLQQARDAIVKAAGGFDHPVWEKVRRRGGQ